MADKVQLKLEELSNKRTAKVKQIKDLQAKLRKAATDAEAKSINLQLKTLDADRTKLESEYNKLAKLKTTAKEYTTLNQKLKTLNQDLARAEARGEDTASINQAISKATGRLSVIAPEVEQNFPELKKTVVTTAAATKPVSGPDAARLGFVSSTETAPTPTPAPKPSAKPGASTGSTTGKVVPSTFNVGTFRQADEASMAKANGVTPAGTLAPTGTKTPLDTLLAKTEFWYDLPDYIFKLDPKLGELLVQAVNEGWDNAKFLAKAQLTPWWQKNSSTVRNRIIDRAKYDELKAAGEDVSKSDYGLYLTKQIRSVKAKAKEIAGVTLTDEQAQSVASKIYDGFLDDDPLAINALITPFIGKVTSIVGNGLSTTGFGGQALQNYQTLQSIAKANGFTIKDILPNISATTAGGDLETAVLRALANGDIDINRVAQDARMLAAQGQPQYVRNLLGQGYDLESIYAPYRQTMASVLEISPDQIDLNDNTLRMAITDKGDMNLYDFKKALRQDSRWQYTGQAKEEVSNAALKVLQDFGFQG